MIIKRVDGGWEYDPTVMARDKIKVLTLAQNMSRDTNHRKGWRKRSTAPVQELEALWASGIFNLRTLEEISGVTRKTLSRWLGSHRSGSQMRARIQTHHYQAIIHLLEQPHNPKREEMIKDMVHEGSSEVLLLAILGKDVYDGHAVRTEVRPDDEGYSEEGEGGSEAEHPSPSSDGLGESNEEPEPADVGEVQGPAAGDSPTEPGTAEEQGEQPEHPSLDAQEFHTFIDAAGTQIIEPIDWNPLDGFEFDESGDSLLHGGEEQGASTGIPGFPTPGAPWEQAEEDES